MMKPIWITALTVAICAQLAVPATMIFKREAALKKGVPVKLKTRPVDPYDAFRGRYVALGYEAASVPGRLLEGGLTRRMKAWAVLKEQDDGYAVVHRVQRKRPADGVYIPVRIGWQNTEKVQLIFPLDRYYMNEREAPEAERLRFQRRRDSEAQPAWVQVRVHRGFSVIEGLYLGDRPVEQAVREVTAEAR